MPTFLHHALSGVRQARATQPATAHTHGTLEREARDAARHIAPTANPPAYSPRTFESSPISESGPLTGGEPLPESARRPVESQLGHDFGRVRIHRGPEAADSAQAVGARAFTIGSHIVFGHGRFAPNLPAGMQLLAHELTHVAQQAGGPAVLQCEPEDPDKKPAENSKPLPVKTPAVTNAPAGQLAKPPAAPAATPAKVDPADQEIARQETALKGMQSLNAGARVGKGTADTVEALIESSQTLRPFIRDKVVGTHVGKNFKIYDFDVQFESKQAELDKIVTPNTGGSQKSANIAYGFFHRKTDSIHLRPSANLGHALHEGIHKYSNVAAQNTLGVFVNEGITQHFTDLVQSEQGVGGKSNNAYGDQLAAAEVLASWLTPAQLAEAYFEGIGMTEVDERVRQELGIDTATRVKLAAGNKGKDLGDKILERRGKPSRATPRKPQSPTPDPAKATP